MRAFLSIIAGFYRRWRFVEEERLEPTDRGGSGGGELDRLRRSLAREERKLADFRQFNCDSLARHCEASIRNLQSRINVLEGNLRRAS